MLMAVGVYTFFWVAGCPRFANRLRSLKTRSRHQTSAYQTLTGTGVFSTKQHIHLLGSQRMFLNELLPIAMN